MSAAPAATLPARPVLASFGVLLGAGIVSLTQRLLSVGLADLRGALGLGFDEAAWVPTACDMALMFMGPFSVYLGGLFGTRRVLLVAGSLFALVSFFLPLSPGLCTILGLQVVVGLTAGTFYFCHSFTGFFHELNYILRFSPVVSK